MSHVLGALLQLWVQHHGNPLLTLSIFPRRPEIPQMQDPGCRLQLSAYESSSNLMNILQSRK